MKKAIEEKVKKRVKAEARRKTQQYKAELNDQGQEICDPQPVAHEIGFKKPMDLEDRMRQAILAVQAETAAKLAAQNMTPEQVQAVLDEENDFSIPEDFEQSLTQYEVAGLLTELDEQVEVINAEPAVESTTETSEPTPEPATQEVASETTTV